MAWHGGSGVCGSSVSKMSGNLAMYQHAHINDVAHTRLQHAPRQQKRQNIKRIKQRNQ